MMKWRLTAGGCLLASMMVVPGAISAQNAATPPEPYVVGEAAPPVEDGTTVVSMTLDEAIARALEANLGLQSARLNPILQAWSYRAAQSAFRPTLGANFGYNSATQQSTSQLDGGATTNTKRATFNTNLGQTLPWYGGRVTMNFNNSRSETNNAFTTRNPSFSSNFSLNFSQPLLAGRSADNQRASLETSQIQNEIANLQLDAEGLNLVNQVRQRYWALRAALEQIEIQSRNLQQAENLLAENEARARLGQATQYQIIQSQAQVATARQSYINAQITWRNQDLAFKQLLLGGADDTLLDQVVNPVDRPTLAVAAANVDIDAAVERALRERSDLRVTREQLRISELNLEVSESNALPTLDLSASYAVSGVGGDLYQRDQLGGAPVLISSGGYFDGLGSIADLDNPTWNISLQASYPIGINPQKVNLERAELQLRQSQIALRQQELNVVTQLTSAGLSVNNTLLQYQAAQQSRAASEQNLAAELERYRLGVATIYELAQAQNQTTSARLSELQSLINHINAIAEFERLQQVGN